MLATLHSSRMHFVMKNRLSGGDDTGVEETHSVASRFSAQFSNFGHWICAIINFLSSIADLFAVCP